jgi:hypothetical protein
MCLVEMGMPAVDPATKAAGHRPGTGKQRVNWGPRRRSPAHERDAGAAHPHDDARS